jgi:hypothetical protein
VRSARSRGRRWDEYVKNSPAGRAAGSVLVQSVKKAHIEDVVGLEPENGDLNWSYRDAAACTYTQCAVLKLRRAVSRTARRVLLRAGGLTFRLEDYWPGLLQRGFFGSLHVATPPLILQVTANFHSIR